MSLNNKYGNWTPSLIVLRDQCCSFRALFYIDFLIRDTVSLQKALGSVTIWDQDVLYIVIAISFIVSLLIIVLPVLKQGIKFLSDPFLWNHANHLIYNLTILEKKKTRDRTDVILCGHALIVINIQLSYFNLTTKIISQFYHYCCSIPQ